MLRNLSGFTYTCYSAAFFSLVKAPAIALFVGFIFLSFNNSIAGTFLSEARSYVADAPANTVRVCLFRKQVEQVQVLESTKPSPPSVYKEKCMTTLIDASDWQQSMDSTIRGLYWNVVFLGFLTWLTININLVGVKDLIMEKIKAGKNRGGL